MKNVETLVSDIAPCSAGSDRVRSHTDGFLELVDITTQRVKASDIPGAERCLEALQKLLEKARPFLDDTSCRCARSAYIAVAKENLELKLRLVEITGNHEIIADLMDCLRQINRIVSP